MVERDARMLVMRLGLDKKRPRFLADISRKLGVIRERMESASSTTPGQPQLERCPVTRHPR